MGDKSPKAVNKKATQKKAGKDLASQRKQQVTAAKPVAAKR